VLLHVPLKEDRGLTTSGHSELDPAADDPRRLAAALGYLFTPVVPLLNLSAARDSDPFVRRHALQALLWCGPFVILLTLAVFLLVLLVRGNFLFICLMPLAIMLPFAPGAIWARRVYLGGDVTIPVIGTMVSSKS
jgi:uncharacterized membrane protein